VNVKNMGGTNPDEIPTRPAENMKKGIGCDRKGDPPMKRETGG